MTTTLQSARRRRGISTAVFVLVLLGAALVFRKELVAWFGGESMNGGGGPVGTKGRSVVDGTSSPSTMASSGSHMAPAQFPPIALDSLRAAMDAADRIRAALSKDQLTGVAESARAGGEAIRAASASLPSGRGDLAAAAAAGMHEAEHLEKEPSIEEARKTFARFNAALLPLVGADERLARGWHVFECPMFEHARWMQRQAAKENPYMGTKMLTCGNPSDWQPTPGASTSTTAAGEVDHYTCSMHPSVKQQGPGKCPICGMDLIPVSKEQQEQGVVMIDDARRQLIGVRTGTVTEGPLRQSFRAVGQVAYDESKLVDVNLKVQGWITKLFVSQTGQRVVRGQPLFSLYSPELYNAQQDFLLANRGASSGAGPATSNPRTDLGRAARQRLHLLGLSDAQIANIEKSGAPMENITISSPAGGFVIEKNVVEGAAVDPGMRLFRIAALNRVWVEADVYEGDLAHVRTGQSATVTLDYFPGRSYEAKVAYVYPYLDPKNRTGRVRVELANEELDLRPGMYASVELAADARSKLQVPAAAVVYTGPRRLVFLDLGQGRFKPQEIRVGLQANGMYEVTEGLHAGDAVATSGVFLIAAEARISTAAKYWDDVDTETAESVHAGGSK
jgi:Cu(I)/Ag(I) efflux system membrane fusion protein